MTSSQPPPPHPHPHPPTGGIQLAALRAVFPGWTFTMTSGPGPAFITARRAHGAAFITATAPSAMELRRILLLAHHA